VEDQIQIRIHGEGGKPTLIYLPGLHGDWTLVGSFRAALDGRVRFVEITYPRPSHWSLHQYADAVTNALAANKISEGWLLGESFSSQIAWAILDRAGQNGFRMQGLILAGGFVRHPVMGAVYFAKCVNRGMPLWMIKLFCAVYSRYAKFRHRRAPETLAGISEFVTNRTNETDRQAMCHRYDIIVQNDLRPVARQARLPVYQLCGLFDPIVPWPFVQPWLKRDCPGFRGCKVIWNADHNVLATAPKASADWVLRWMAGEVISNQ
jgi:pimeloyl-ACP methyl ester carboxylesterase